LNVADVLETVPGVSVARAGSYGGATSVFVRGGESDFNLVLIDGVQVNRPGGEYDLANLSTANIERIEIVRGPSSVLYGTEAVSSTIHIITRSGRKNGTPGGNVSAVAGGMGSQDYQARLDGGSDRVRYAFGAMSTQTDGIFDFNSGYRRSDLSARNDFEISPGTSLGASLRYTAGTQHVPTDDSGAIVDPNDYRDIAEQTYSVHLQRQFSTRYDSRIQYGYFRHHAYNYTLEDGVTDFFDSIFESDENRHYIDWQNNIRLIPGHLLATGASWKEESSRVIDSSRRSLGLYLQDQVSVGNRLFLTGGIRHEANNRFSNFVTGQFDASYLLTDSLRIRGSLGNGFRAPAFSEIVGFPEFGIAGNPALRPEKNTAAEAGADFSIRGSWLQLSGTVFSNRFRDLIEFTFATAPGTPNFINVEAANSRGLEFQGTWRPSALLSFGSWYTFTATKVTDAGSVPSGNFEEGLPLLRRPRHLAGVFGGIKGSRLSLRLDLLYKGTRDDRVFLPDFSSTRVKLPGYFRVDCFGSVPLVRLADGGRVLAAVFRGENIFNSSYQEVAGFPSPGRRLRGGLEFSF
jgi:vitamin B12 transporter